MIFSQISAVGLTAIVTLLLGVLGLLTSFRNFRSLGQQRFRNLDERTKAVAFWTAWLAAQEKVSTEEEMAANRAMVQQQLTDLATFVAREAAAAAQHSWIAYLLILRPPRRLWAWVPRLAYYAIGALGLAYASVVLVILSQTRIPKEQALSVGVKYIVTVALFVVVAAILRQVALLADAPARPPPPGTATP